MIIAKMHHICIQTNDYAESLAFYRNCLGFSLVQETPNFHGRAYNTWLALGDFFIEMQTPKQPAVLDDYNKEAAGIVHFALYVADLDVALSELQAQGFSNFKLKDGQVIYSVEGGRLLKLAAPEGTIIEMRETWNL